MKNRQTIKLRGHHIGVLFDILKKMEEGKSYFETIMDISYESSKYNYSPKALTAIENVLLKIFHYPETNILIVEGLDSLCLAGCLKHWEKLALKTRDKMTRRCFKDKIASCKANTMHDIQILEAVGLSINDRLKANALLAILKNTVHEYQTVADWPSLATEYIDRKYGD